MLCIDSCGDFDFDPAGREQLAINERRERTTRVRMGKNLG